MQGPPPSFRARKGKLIHMAIRINRFSQELTNDSFNEQCIPSVATSPNVTFSPPRTSSPKSKGTTSENFMPQAAENIDTKIKESMARNWLEGDEYSNSSQ